MRSRGNMPDHSTHESFRDRDAIKSSSNLSFGIVFAVLFALIGLFPLIGGSSVQWWSLIVAVTFLVLALARPKLLAPLNRLWMRFGLLLHRIVNPLVMALLFFLVVTPIALLMRLFGKRPLHQNSEADADSYWIPREPPGPEPETMKQQF